MKINGKPVRPPSPVKHTIYRENEQGEPENITFICGAVLDYSEFLSLCPQPTAPLKTDIKTGTETYDFNDRRYDAKISVWSQRRVAWMILKSLSHTPGLEWDNVKANEPDTWLLYEDELQSFLTDKEATALINAAVEANSPTQNRRKEALENFTSTQPEQVNQDSSSPAEEPTITLSTEPANV